MENKKALTEKLNEIEKELNKNHDGILSSASNIQIYFNFLTAEATGFDITLTNETPNVHLVYEKGICKLTENKGFDIHEKQIDKKICEDIFWDLTE